MNIAIAGLGLIGGSFAKAIHQYTNHTVTGHDTCAETIAQALKQGYIQAAAEDDFSTVDMVLVALYPGDAVAFVEKILPTLKAGAMVVDLCGVKRFVCHRLRPLFQNSGVAFIGGHPMAGRECSGFQNAFPELFQGASMILTPYPDTPPDTLAQASDFFLSLGFGHIEVTTDHRHDEMIAYTSQLAHIVSSAYIRSPEARDYQGFSANSFKDLTRVAKLNETMWTELFLHNGDFLTQQIQVIIDNLAGFRDAIQDGDRDALLGMLREGREIKERLEADG